MEPLGESCGHRWQYSMCEKAVVEVMNFGVSFCPKSCSGLSFSFLHHLLARILAKDATEATTVGVIGMFRSDPHFRSEETLRRTVVILASESPH